MESVIQTLRELASAEDTRLGDLIDKALFHATVLQQKPITHWLHLERDGYPQDADVPAYRLAESTTLIAWRPGVGWVEAPVTEDQTSGLTGVELRTDIPALLRKRAETRKAGMHRVDLDESHEQQLRNSTQLDTRLALVVPASAYERILDTVHIAIRIWCERLLEAGIQGHGSAFSREEKELARPVADELESILAEAGAEQAQLPPPKAPGLMARLFGRT